MMFNKTNKVKIRLLPVFYLCSRFDRVGKTQ